MLLRPYNFFILFFAGIIVFSCSSTNNQSDLLKMFSGNPERIVQVAIKDGDEKQLKNAWDKKALSLCKSGYEINNLSKAVSTAGGHNSLTGSISCR